MNLPNLLTLFRILLVPVLLLVYFSEFSYADQVTCIIFIIASVTDALDGYVARKYHLVTNFGKICDPLADKLLVLSLLIALTVKNVLPLWIVIVILARELTITSLRAVAAGEGIIVAASSLGKIKTIFQMLGIIMLLFHVPLAMVFIYTAVVLTIVSAIEYILHLNKDISWM